MHAGMTEIHARMHDMRRIPPHRAHARIRRASLCTPDRSNVPTNETSGAESKCWRQSTHRGQNLNHTCTRATRTRHRPGAPSSKGRPTRTSRLFRGSESGDSIWLLEAPAGVDCFGSCGSRHVSALLGPYNGDPQNPSFCRNAKLTTCMSFRPLISSKLKKSRMLKKSRIGKSRPQFQPRLTTTQDQDRGRRG